MMFRTMNRYWVLAVGIAFLATAGIAEAGISKKDKKAANQIANQGTLYAKIDIPCKTGRHAFGTYLAPLVEVSPEGSNSDASYGSDSGFYHAESTFWAVAPHDSVKTEDVEWDGTDVEIQVEGVGKSDGNDSVVKLTKINSLDDFKKAFDLVFSTAPLQDGHPDWSEEIRKAVGERRLLKGMSKRQAFYIVGGPERVEKQETDGTKIVTWFTRQSRGTQVGFWTSNSESTSFPSQLKFVDGKLTEIGASSVELDLDD
jgi:hypothetical protein